MYVCSRLGETELGGFLAHRAVAYAYHLGQLLVGGGSVVAAQDGEHVVRPVYLVPARLAVEHAQAAIDGASEHARPCFRWAFLATDVLVAETLLAVGIQPVGFCGFVERTLWQYTLAAGAVFLLWAYGDGVTLGLALQLALVGGTHIGSLGCLATALATVEVVILGAVAPAGAQGKVGEELDALAMAAAFGFLIGHRCNRML